MNTNIEVGKMDGGNVAGGNINIFNFSSNQSLSATEHMKEKKSVVQRGLFL